MKDKNIDYHIPIFSKEAIVYGLINSSIYPNYLIPIKCKILDYQYKKTNPLYQIKILKIYSNFNDVKKFFGRGKFKRRIKSTMSEKFKADPRKFENLEQFQQELNADNKAEYAIWQEAIMLFNTKKEAFKVFNEITNVAIEIRLKELALLMTNSNYDGIFSLSYNTDFWNWSDSQFPEYKKIRNMSAKQKKNWTKN